MRILQRQKQEPTSAFLTADAMIDLWAVTLAGTNPALPFLAAPRRDNARVGTAQACIQSLFSLDFVEALPAA